MSTGFRIALFAVLAVVSRNASSSDADDAALAADGAFAAMAAERGERAAFEEFLSEDAIVFRPGAVVAHEWIATHEQGSGRLDWTPAAAASDCTDGWAVTTGPWVYSNSQGEQSATGQYVSIWRREPDGEWRVVLDNGIDYDTNSKPAPLLQPTFAGLWPPQPAGECQVVDAVATLKQAEQDLNEAIASVGLAAALSHATDPDALAFRDDSAPGAVADAVAADAAYAQGSAARSQFVSADPDSDFGYSYGVVEARASIRASYVRVWRRDGLQWRVALDLMSPLPVDAGQ